MHQEENVRKMNEWVVSCSRTQGQENYTKKLYFIKH